TEELDYTVEAANAEAVAAGTGTDGAGDAGPLVRVPATYPSLTTSRVLVMERVSGVPLSRPDATRCLDLATRERLARALLASVLTQVLQTGVFHADLHAGNVLVERGWSAGGEEGAPTGGEEGASTGDDEGGSSDGARLALLDY